MFEKNIIITGKHASYVKFLSEKTKQLGEGQSKNGAGIFDRNIDVFMIAPLVGAIYNRTAKADTSTDEKSNVFAEQLSKEKLNIQFIYNLINLVDTSKGLSADEKIESVFRNEGNMDLFLSYVRGGIEYLYEHFSEGSATKNDYYEKIVDLVNSIQFESTDNYDTLLKSITE